MHSRHAIGMATLAASLALGGCGDSREGGGGLADMFTPAASCAQLAAGPLNIADGVAGRRLTAIDTAKAVPVCEREAANPAAPARTLGQLARTRIAASRFGDKPGKAALNEIIGIVQPAAEAGDPWSMMQLAASSMQNMKDIPHVRALAYASLKRLESADAAEPEVMFARLGLLAVIVNGWTYELQSYDMRSPEYAEANRIAQSEAAAPALEAAIEDAIRQLGWRRFYEGYAEFEAMGLCYRMACFGMSDRIMYNADAATLTAYAADRFIGVLQLYEASRQLDGEAARNTRHAAVSQIDRIEHFVKSAGEKASPAEQADVRELRQMLDDFDARLRRDNDADDAAAAAPWLALGALILNGLLTPDTPEQQARALEWADQQKRAQCQGDWVRSLDMSLDMSSSMQLSNNPDCYGYY